MAGEFTAGLSGGQRKMLLFELIYQRTLEQKNLLIVLDEPFAGVTDDFVPFLTDRLNKMRENHNILLVTNDHVDAMKNISDNVITVSAIDRTKVSVNDRKSVDRDMVLNAMSLGSEYMRGLSNSDLSFFWQVEVASNKALLLILVTSTIYYALFIACFWDPAPGGEALVLTGGGLISFFAMQPYLLSLPDWRTINVEEADALLHSSISRNKLLKTLVAASLCVFITVIWYFAVYGVTDSFRNLKFFYAMLTENVSLTFPFMFLGIYSDLPLQYVQIIGGLPFILMIYFSTTFAPGAGIPGLKELRYLFSRFYFWCIIPGVQDSMEGCPAKLGELYMGLTSVMVSIIFFGVRFILQRKAKRDKKAIKKEKVSHIDENELDQLKEELYGKEKLRSFSMVGETLTEGYNIVEDEENAFAEEVAA